MKRKEGGYYRMLWNEYARTVPFSWHRTHKGAETIPKAYRYQGNVSSDYYHQLCEGAAGLEAYAEEADMVIDWESGRLRPKPVEPPPYADQGALDALKARLGQSSE